MTVEVRLEDYRGLVETGLLEEIRLLAAPFKGLRVQHVNSTRQGGGVAEILERLVPLFRDVGVDARWDVLEGDAGFFRVTKAIHTGLHGQQSGFDADEAVRAYARVGERNRGVLDPDADIIVLHDPQPLALLRGGIPPRARVVWRCHVDVSEADAAVWTFLRPMVVGVDLTVFHMPEYARDLPCPQIVLPPAIDPISAKNREMDPAEIRDALRAIGVELGPSTVLQVSRFDRLKDPIGVLRAFRAVRRTVECRLILAGGGADDDPEGARVLEEVRAAAAGDPDVRILALPPDAHREVNALQRSADVVVQKSLREGFGLVVTEAMWKGRPVVGGHVGGIRRQITHRVSGYLVHTMEGAALRIRQLLLDPELARRIGEVAREHVRRNFLMPTYLRNWLLILHRLAPGTRGGESRTG